MATDRTELQKDWCGESIGQLTFLRFDSYGGKAKNKTAYWQAICDCGQGRVINIELAKRLQSCGHDAPERHFKDAVSRRVRKVGETYGKWEIIDFDPESRGRNISYKVKCVDCGNIRWGAYGHLKRDLVRCHGCSYESSYYGQELPWGYLSEKSVTKKVWNRWLLMNERCSSDVPRYGGRGIAVCEEWAPANPKGYLNYLNWIMESYPEDWEDRINNHYHLDRTDNDQGYSPNNCRLVTAKENMRNTCRTLMVEYKGQTVPLVSLAEDSAIDPRTVYTRVKNMGWSVEEALTIPEYGKRKIKPFSVVVEFRGKDRFLNELVQEESALDYSTVRARMKRGWDLEKALKAPLTSRGRHTR